MISVIVLSDLMVLLGLVFDDSPSAFEALF